MASPSLSSKAAPTSASTSASASGAPPGSADGRRTSGIRRSRPSYSCEACRTRRVKCDQLRPKCSSCARNGVQCVYGETSRKRKDHPDGIVAKVSPTKTVRRTLEADEKQPSNHGYLLMQNGGRSRYIENTFWACVDVEGLELDSLLFDLPLFPLEDACCAACQDPASGEASGSPCQHYIGTAEPNYSFWSSRRPVGPGGGRSLASTLAALPARETCDSFYDDFVGSVHPLIPLIHLPTFDHHYRRFWDWYQTWEPGRAPEGVLAENPSFLPLLFTVLFTGSIARSRPDQGGNTTPPLETQKKLYYLIPSTLSMVGFPYSPSLYSLMAFLLLNSMLIREEESLSSCSFVAVAFRVCQAMGLHKEGTHFGLEDIQVEERRRVWCHLMHLDVMTSIVSGLPLVASSDMFSDTRMIREIRDEYLGKPHSEDAEADLPIDLNYIITAGRYDASSCLRDILVRQFSPRPVTSACIKEFEEKIEALQTRTEKRIARLTTQSQQEYDSSSSIYSLSSASPGNVAENINPRVLWGKDLLHLMIEKAYCLLYQPIMRDISLWKEIRPRAIPRFQYFLSIFIDMSTTESYLPYQWLYPGAYQPLQPVAVLLIDLLNNPQSEESPKSRALLEKAFSLLGPGGRMINGSSPTNWPDQRHASTGSKQAWMRLEKLRSKVWQKLGLDHNVLWMRSISASAGPSRGSNTPEQTYQNEQLIPRYPVSLDQINELNPNLPLDADAQNMAYADNAFLDPQVGFFPFLEDGMVPGDGLEQAIDPSWQALGLPGDVTSVIPPFSNVNYIG